MSPITPDSIERRTFYVSTIALLLVFTGLVLAAIVPMRMVFELASTGTIDLDAVSPTRRKIPVWILYLGSTMIFLPAFWFAIPIWRYVPNREMFQLTRDGILLRNRLIKKDDVVGFRFSFLRGYHLQTTQGAFSIHPAMSKGATEALIKAFPKTPPYGGRVPSFWRYKK